MLRSQLIFRMFTMFFVLNILIVTKGYSNLPLREVLSTMQNEISNLNAEVRILEEKSKNQGVAIESLRGRLIEADVNQKNLLKGSTGAVDARVADLELSSKNIGSDLKKLQNHANQTSATLSQYKNKIEELEALLKNQNEHISSIQEAIGSVMAALNIPQKSPSNSVYTVQNGDTLEKIARREKTSINKIKTLNSLKNDRIYIGQKLKLP